MAVDIWILEVRDPSRAVRGLTSAFGLTHAQSEKIVASLPYRVKRNVREQDAPRYKDKLKAIGANATWGPAGDSVAPPPRVEVPPNNPPEEPVHIPDVPEAFDPKRARLYGALLGFGVLVAIGVALGADGLSSGEGTWPAAIVGGLALCALATGVFGLVLGFFQIPIASPVLPLMCGGLGAAICILVLISSEPDPQERLSHVAALRAEVLGGQAREGRTFLDGDGIFATADAARSRAFIESLYDSGARRVLVIDEDEDGEAEWVAIDMPVLPGRRSAIAGAVRSYAGANFTEIPSELATPSRARHWIIPVDIH